MKLSELDEHFLCDAREAILAQLRYHQLSASDILKLLAISFTNTPSRIIVIARLRIRLLNLLGL